jgi:hypothetical protein
VFLEGTLSGPKPDVDYGKLTAEMPQLRAFLEDDDHEIMRIGAMATFLLVDERPDSKNHASHLVISKAQRKQLVSDLSADFGDKLKQKNPNYVVGSAVILNDFLTKKGFKCADEPWE